jgi:hypothetical protein
MFLNIIKTIYEKIIANIRPNRKQLKALPLESRMRQRCMLSRLLFNTAFEFLARAIRQEQEMKGFQTGKEEFKPSYFQMT